MCGIVGYTGSQAAAPILLEGLKKPENGCDIDKPKNPAKSVTVE